MAKLGSLYFSILYKDDPKQLEAIKKRALKQLKNLEVKLKVSSTTTGATTKSGKSRASATKEEIGYIEQLLQRVKELEQQYKKLPKSADATKTIQEFSQVKKELDDVGKNLIEASKKQNLAEGSLVSYRAELSKLIYEYDRLSAAEREAAAGKELLKNIQQTTIKLNEAEQASMRYQRNVGNYKSGFNGLTFQVQQLARELPSLAYGANIFFAAISNNVPMFADEVKRANEEYKILRQQQKEGMNLNVKAVPVWRQLISSIFSWQTAIVAAVTIMTFFGAKIFDAIGKMLKFGDATKLTKKEIKELGKTFAEAAGSEIAKLDVLFNNLDKTREGTLEWYDARNKILEQHPSLLSSMDSEITSLHDKAGAYRLLRDEMYATAKAAAIEKATKDAREEAIDVATKNYDKIYDQAVIKKGKDYADDFINRLRKDIETTGKVSDELNKEISNIFTTKTEETITDKWGDTYKVVFKENKILPLIDKITKAQDALRKKTENAESLFDWLKITDKDVKENKEFLTRQRNILQTQLEGLTTTEAAGVKGLQLKKQIKAIDDAIKAAYGTGDTEGTGRAEKENDPLKERVALLMEANALYEEWLKISGRDKAKSVAKALYPEFDPDTLRSELETIQRTGSKEASKEATKALIGLDKNTVEISLSDVEKQITETIAKWDLFSKLYKESGDYQFSINAAFGGKVGFKSVLEQLQKEIEDAIKGNKFGVSFNDIIKADERTVTGMFGGKTSALVKAYQDESKKLSDESLMRAAELLSTYKNYEQQRKDIIAKGEQDVADLIQNGASQEAIKEAQKRTEEAIASLNFEEFKGTDSWIKAFEDIDRLSTDAINNIISDLENFKSSAGKNLKVDEFKELMSVLKKLRNEYESRNPFKSLIEGIIEYADATKRLKEANKNLNIIQSGGKVQTGYTPTYTTKTDTSGAIPTTRKEVTGLTAQYKTLEQAQTEASNAGVELAAAEGKIALAFKNAQAYLDIFLSTLGSIRSMFEALGNEGVADSIGYAMDAISSVSNIGEGFAKGGKVGGIVAAIGEAAKWVGKIAQAHDKKLNKSIQKSEAEVRKLEAAYKLIEVSLGHALGNQNELIQAQKKNLELQLKELKIQRDAEAAKKKSDKAKLADYDAAIASAEQNLQYFAEDAAKDLYNIDLKGWASQLGDALFEAWK
ncbi:MAG: hypothetical protein KA467_01275, partial [Bacteroidales bacterium]|nr:hypothetical protein [Bacteroidales bacterium]